MTVTYAADLNNIRRVSFVKGTFINDVTRGGGYYFCEAMFQHVKNSNFSVTEGAGGGGVTESPILRDVIYGLPPLEL